MSSATHRHSRYSGEAKTHLRHWASTSAINLIRIGDWLLKRRGQRPVARPSNVFFVQLVTLVLPLSLPAVPNMPENR